MRPTRFFPVSVGTGIRRRHYRSLGVNMRRILILALFLILAPIVHGQGQNFPGGSGLAFVASLPVTCTPGVTASVQLSVAPYTVNYCSAPNTWTPLGASTGSAIGTAGQSAYFGSLNTLNGGTLVLDMAGVAGADLGAKMNNCATALPAAGGTCKGDNLTGGLTLSTAVTTTKPVVYTFSGQSISQTAAISLANGNSGITACSGSPPTFTKAANIDQITLSQNSTFVSCLILVGQSGSFTGNGIVATAAANFAFIQGNNVSGEAGQAIKSASSSSQIQFNTVSSSASSQAAILLSGNGGSINFNNVTVNAGDGIDVTGNQDSVVNNFVSLNITSALSGICGINAAGDQIGDRITFNQTQITDSHGGDVNYGECDTPSGTHNLNVLFYGGNHFGVLSGGATADGFFLNNANNINTNWIVSVKDEACVHLTFCIKRTDTQGNRTTYEDIQPGDTALDAGTGSANDVFIFENTPLAFANLPTPVGNASRGYCSDCTTGRTIAAAGGPGTYVTRTGGNWFGVASTSWSFVQGKEQNASAASLNVTFTNHNAPGNLIVVGILCLQAAQPTLAVTDTSNTYFSAIAIKSDPTSARWEQIFYGNAIVGGANTVAVSSSVNACTFIDVFIEEYSGLLAQSPEDGAGASANGNSTALATGPFTVTQNDLVIGFGLSNIGTMIGGAGFTTRQTGNSGASLFEDQIAGSSSVNATMSAASGNWAISGVAFKLAP